jgi:hypothetical protein
MWKRKTAVFLINQSLSLFGSSLVRYALLRKTSWNAFPV